ncbi:MAG: hypothetical protein KA797_03665 [Chitinophagales bacterium]|nr:hypothetical protein [Chitinophagales bacterium]
MFHCKENGIRPKEETTRLKEPALSLKEIVFYGKGNGIYLKEETTPLKEPVLSHREIVFHYKGNGICLKEGIMLFKEHPFYLRQKVYYLKKALIWLWYNMDRNSSTASKYKIQNSRLQTPDSIPTLCRDQTPKTIYLVTFP